MNRLYSELEEALWQQLFLSSQFWLSEKLEEIQESEMFKQLKPSFAWQMFTKVKPQKTTVTTIAQHQLNHQN